VTPRLLLALLMTGAAAFPSAAGPSVVFSPTEWKFGMIQRGEKIQTVVKAKNTTEAQVTVSLLPTCTCNTASPAELVLPPGSEGNFVITYDSSDDTGITRKDFIVQTKPPGVTPRYYTITGVVRGERQATAPGGARSVAAGGGEASPVIVLNYHKPGCRNGNSSFQ
jgi:hypothetical protein